MLLLPSSNRGRTEAVEVKIVGNSKKMGFIKEEVAASTNNLSAINKDSVCPASSSDADKIKASQLIVENVQMYCKNIRINANEYFREENQKLACLVSNINQILQLKLINATGTAAATVDYDLNPNLANGDHSQVYIEGSSSKKNEGNGQKLRDSSSALSLHINENQCQIATVELVQAEKLGEELKQQVDAFQTLASNDTPHLKIACEQLRLLLEGKNPLDLNVDQVPTLSNDNTTGSEAGAIKIEKLELTQHEDVHSGSKNFTDANFQHEDPGLIATTPPELAVQRRDKCSKDKDMDVDTDLIPENNGLNRLPKSLDSKHNSDEDEGNTDVDMSVEDSDEDDDDSSNDSDVEGLAPPKKKLKSRHAAAAVPEEEKPPSLEEQVFGNQLLIKTIFNKLSPKTLKQLRGVNKMFNNFATEILVRRQSLKILISHDRVRLQNDNGQLINLDLTQACQSLITSVKLFQRLPTDRFEFLNTNLEAPALQNFLSECGHLVKVLKLDFYSGNISIFAFQHLLLHQVPNLHTLYFDNVPPAWKKICTDLVLFRNHQGWIKLNCLKSIKVGPQRTCVVPPKLLQNLVCAAVNLEGVKGCRGSNFLAFLKEKDQYLSGPDPDTSHLHLMKTLTFDPRPENLDLYQRFLDQQPSEPNQSCLQVKKLEIEMEELLAHPETWPRVTSILNQFLRLSSSTLEKFVINDRLGFLEKHELKLPTFPMVKKLNMIIVEDSTLQDFEKKILPSNSQISEIFPKVETLKVVIWENSGEEPCDVFFKYFAKPLVIPSVTKLELMCQWDCQLPLYWLEQFSGLAPNVKVANFGVLSIGDFVDAAKCIWGQLSKLEEIKFTIDIDTFVMETIMDMAFTGFSEETCRRLRKQQQNRLQNQSMPQNEICAEDWEDERENPSILDLKQLREIRVDFVMKTVRKNAYPVFLSCVAGLYAFKMCPNLKVSIGVDTSQGEDPTELNKSLETIRPYVKMDSSLN